jgi:hypothetical protein
MDWIHLIDFGLVILIWLVQLVVYPSFKYYASSDLLQWHRAYTRGITVVVLPLMLAQLLLHGWRVHDAPSLPHVCLLLLVVSTWLTTFTIFVPLHNNIVAGQALSTTLARLVRYNWMRTVLWSVIFLWGLGVHG